MKRTSNPSFLPEGIINKANITSGIYWSKLFLYISKGEVSQTPQTICSHALLTLIAIKIKKSDLVT